ncbi:MAG TPA: HAD-IIIA family hydrolase, partial [Pirellulales bacterium]|nr:HAD-IIIA family hydrolase [Pirellulales bacterium]
MPTRTDTALNSKRAIFLDRDGTLTQDLGFVHRPADLRLLVNAVAGLRRMSDEGFRLFITTNQSGIARGYFSEADMQA